MSDERALVAAWRGGNERAGQQLFSRHFDAVGRFFATKVAHGMDDLVQRTFLACVQQKERWPESVGFRAYILGIARNMLRRRFREQEFAGRRFDVLESSVADSGISPSSIVHARREVEVLVRAMARLPLDLQIALELRYWEDLKLVEIASVLEIAEGTAKTRIRRAHQLLAHAVETVAADPLLARSTVDGAERWAKLLRERLSTPGSAIPQRG